MLSDAILVIDGVPFKGWTGVSVTCSLDSAVRTFSFDSVPNKGGLYGGLRSVGNARYGSDVKVLLGNSRVVSGWVEHINPRLKRDDVGVTIAGRSKTCDIVDCSIKTNTPFLRVPLLTVAQALCLPYGVTVKGEIGSAAFSIVSMAHFHKDATVYAAIEKQCRKSRVRLYDDEYGTLHIGTGLDNTGAKGSLREGINIENASVEFDGSQRFSSYEVHGVRVGADLDPALTVDSAAADDAIVPRYRMLRIRGESSADKAWCKARAEWEAITRAGQSITAEITVKGWEWAPGFIWKPGQMTAVLSEMLGITETLVINACTYTDGDKGPETQLTLQPMGAFLQLPGKPVLRMARKKSLWGIIL